MECRRCTVVIATKDRREALERALRGLADQTVDDFAVVIVDDGSSEPIAEWLRPEDFLFEIELVRHDVSRGPAAARNAGVAAADAELIVFVDDDVAPSPQFLAAHLDLVGSVAPGAPPIVTCGPFVQPADWDPTPWNLWEARQARKEADLLSSGELPVSWRNFHTGNNCVPRAVFQAVGGFDETFTRAEDDEFGARLARAGCEFRYVPDALGWHYAHRSLESWRAIPKAYARYDVEIDRTYPEAGYLAAKKAELDQRKWPLRIARMTFAGRRRRLGIEGAIWFGRQLYRFGRVDWSVAAFSVAYDLSYVQSLLETEAEAAT